MEEIIKCSYPPGSADAEEIKNGRYTLHHDDQDVLLASWDDFVRHGLRIALKVWECDPIEFKDAVGRKFNFPWSMAKTWKVSRKLSQPMYSLWCSKPADAVPNGN